MTRSWILFIGVMIGVVTGSVVAAQAANVQGQVTFCVDKKTNVVEYKAKCTSKEKALSLSKNGVPGPAGSPGPAGPSGSSFALSQYPVLWGQVDGLNNATCQDKWTMLIGSFNIESDRLGQPIRNKPWALSYAGDCIYPMPEIFELPRITEVTSIVHGSKTITAANNIYVKSPGYEAAITGLTVKVSLDSGWHICTSADPQYAALNMSAGQAGWSQTAPDTVVFSGSKKAFWSLHANPTDLAAIGEEGFWPKFCGPDNRTASGSGYRSPQAWYLPLQFNDPSL